MIEIPNVGESILDAALKQAKDSERLRHAVVLHECGAYINRVFNVVVHGSYMRPHRHLGDDRAETMICVYGEFALLTFSDSGVIKSIDTVASGTPNFAAKVLPGTFHTYIILSEYSIIFEQLNGVYHPDTWKDFPNWAPLESMQEDSSAYIQKLYADVRSD